jgi:hypothetical protein
MKIVELPMQMAIHNISWRVMIEAR